MRLLYISQYFPPEAGATQTRAWENVLYLAKAGHEVTVVCEIPNHPAGVVFPGYRGCLVKRQRVEGSVENAPAGAMPGTKPTSNADKLLRRVEKRGERIEGRGWGFQVIYVRVLTFEKKNFLTRLGFYFSFMAGTVLTGLWQGKKFDAVYATSPPLPAAGAGLWLARHWKIPFFFEVRDLWPDSAVALGELKNPWAVKLAARLEQACYDRAAKIIAVTQGILDTLEKKKQVPARKTALIPNGATTDSFFHDPAAGEKLREKYGVTDRFVVLYAGILGIAQGLEILIQAADQLEDREDIHFLVAGAGPKKEALHRQALQLGLTNLDFVGEHARDRMPGLYAAADAALVPLVKNDLFVHARPSKLFDAWACETPVLLGINGEARQLLDQCRGGLFYEPENAQDLVEKILALKALPWTRRRKMGKDARRFAALFHSRQVYAEKLEKLMRTAL